MADLSCQDAERIRRIRAAVFQTQGLGHLTQFAIDHTTIKGKPFNFKGYEYQQAIMDDPSLDVVVGKPRQVGASELFLRLLLAFLATTPNANGMLILPHVHKALMMVKSRVDVIIQGSALLRSMLIPGSDSASFKSFGTSQLHTAGSHGGDIISVPVQIRLIDEYDYCVESVLSTSDATMDESDFVDTITGQRGVRRNFSTPLTPKRGVHALYEGSDKKKRLVKTNCNHFFHPQYVNVVVDGWDNPILDLTPEDTYHLDRRGLLQTARILCPECRKTVPHERLAPQYREWVAENPSNKTRSGYWITPFDAAFDAMGRPKRTAQWLVRSRADFGSNVAHFYNHRLGLPYADTTNSFLDTAIAENAVLYPLSPQAAALSSPQELYGLVAGIDTGKPSWGAIGRPLPDGRVDVLWLFTIPIQGPNAEDLPSLIFELLAPYRLAMLVVDCQPYTDSVLKLQSLYPNQYSDPSPDSPHTVLARDYRLKDTSLQAIQVKPNGLEVTTHRTRTLSALASAINAGKFRFPRPDLSPLMGHDTTKPGTLRNHASNITKISLDPDDNRESAHAWVGDNEHFIQALNYLSIAASLVQARFFTQGFVPLPTPMPCTPGSALVTAQTHNRRLDINRQGTVLVDALGTEGVAESLFNHFR